VYAFLLGQPSGKTLTIKDIEPKPGTRITLLGAHYPLTWEQEGSDVVLAWPENVPGKYAYGLAWEEWSAVVAKPAQ
jgi:Alpha-L-fucosidase C-terminal domain